MRTIRMYHHPVYNSTHQSWRQCTSAMLFQDLHTERHCEVLVFYTKKKDMTSSSSASDLSVSEGTDSDFEVSERFESDSRPVFNIKRPRRNEPTCDDVLGTHGLRMISCISCSHLPAWLVAYAYAWCINIWLHDYNCISLIVSVQFSLRKSMSEFSSRRSVDS